MGRGKGEAKEGKGRGVKDFERKERGKGMEKGVKGREGEKGR